MPDTYCARRPDKYNGLGLSGKYKIVVKDNNGKVVLKTSGSNLITSAGETLVAELLDVDTAEVAPKYIAFGSGTNGALKTDTRLQAEISSTRELADTITPSTNTLALEFAITVSGTYTIEEMGILNALTDGTLFSRFLTQSLDVVPGFLIEITWILTISGID
jgi:hypothetical protein